MRCITGAIEIAYHHGVDARIAVLDPGQGGFDRIDLSGLTTTAGITFRF